MDQSLTAASPACLIPKTTYGRTKTTDPAIMIAEGFAEALATLDEDRRLIAFARSTVRDLYLALEERDRRIVNARFEIHAAYIAAEALVSARGVGRVGVSRRKAA